MIGRLCASIFILGCISAKAEPNAFGIRPGTKARDVIYDASEKMKPGSIVLKSIPRPHHLLKNYYFEVNSKLEICSVTGSSEQLYASFEKEYDATVKEAEEVYGAYITDKRFSLDTRTFESAEMRVTITKFASISSFSIEMIFKPIEDCAGRKSGNSFR